MKPWESIEQTRTADGIDLRLTRRDDEYVILSDGLTLMSSRMHGSEEALATLAYDRMPPQDRPCVLIGGLGMGFTLRAVLDRLPAAASVTVAELVPAVIEWNRGPLGPLAGYPLTDRRVRVHTGDVAAAVHMARGTLDAILLDVDNGPAAFTVPRNASLYDDRGVGQVHTALRSGGVLAVWSVREDRAFAQRLRRAGFVVSVERVRARLTKGSRHFIILGQKRPAGRSRDRGPQTRPGSTVTRPRSGARAHPGRAGRDAPGTR